MKRARPLMLNVDDDDAGRYAVGRTLRQAGFDVLETAMGAEGIALAEAHQPDLILLDVRLPDIDGFEVCRRLRKSSATQGIPVLQMSASYLDVSSRVKGLENGADAYLTEPVEPPILVATIRSLLRLKDAENKVRSAALEWQSTFDAIQDGVALLDAAGNVTRCNSAFQQTGVTEVHLSELLRLSKIARSRQCMEVEVGAASLSLTFDPVTADAGELAGGVCVAVDITEKKRFETELRQTARLESIGVLAGGIAHDFNNLLTGILGNASLMLETLPSESPDRALLVEILKASESAADLTKQVLAYSGKGNYMMRPVALSDLTMETRLFVRRFFPPHVELTFETEPGLPLVEADRTQMQQVLMNLIINAAESFAPGAHGSVKVNLEKRTLGADFFTAGETSAPGEYVLLQVTDTGAGMDAATRDLIFDPFFTTKFAGRGLGLSAVRGILQAHKGYLRLETEPGKGTSFRLYFPATDAVRTVTAPAAESSSKKGSGTLLVIDDERVIRSFAKAALEMRGYDVLVAEDGRAGIEMYQQHQGAIRLVLLDLAMPVMDGAETFERLRELRAEVPVVLSSGFSQAVAAERFRDQGLAGFLGKPYTGKQLNAAVEAALSGHSDQFGAAGLREREDQNAAQQKEG